MRKNTENFFLVMNILVNQKWYSYAEAERIARKIFKEAKASKRSVEQILCDMPSRGDIV